MSAPARTIFLGSGSFAIPSLARLAGLPDVELRATVSAPARPRGRGGRVQPSAVSAWAADHGLPSLTPERLRSDDAVEQLRGLAPELLVLADYGQLVPPALLELPRHGALNLHPSLLPRHRGASPVAATILAGERQTGVTLMQMDAGLDSGPIIAQRTLELEGSETAAELETGLADLAAELLAESLPAWLAGELSARPQPAEGVSLTRPLRREDGRLDPARPAEQLERQVRAYQPWPGSFLETPAGRLIVWRAAVLPRPVAGPAEAPGPGQLLRLPYDAEGAGLALATAEGLLELREVQPAGGRRMSGAELLRGRPALVAAAR